jgi:hypothetical protein
MPNTGLCRNVKTLTDLWEEWFSGREGCLSVVEMNQRWGGQWRKVSRDEQFYSCRKKIIEAIQKHAVDQEVEPATMCQQLEHKHIENKKTLDWIAKNISVFLSE